MPLHAELRDREFTLDQVVLSPGIVSITQASEVDLSARLSKSIILKSPLISSPMDTVTGHKMAILMAKMGGIGVVHFNFPSIDAQIAEIRKVRRYEAGFVLEPEVISVDATVEGVFKKAAEHGFYSFPVTQDGTLQSRLVGFVTHRDVRYRREEGERSVTQVMTPLERLIVADASSTLEAQDLKAANALIRKHNLDTLPVVDSQGRIVALVTDSDLEKNDHYPNATKDDNKQLKVLAAVESRLSMARDRIEAVNEAGASGIVVDSRNIFRDHLEIAKFAKEVNPDWTVIVGNVVTSDVVREVMDQAGQYIDAFRVGIGTGEVCTTTEDLGIGRAMGSSLRDITTALEPFKAIYGHIGVIADGGIKLPRHILAALALGADAAMMGTELAGLDESPTATHYDGNTGRMVKSVRGMGSEDVIRERAGASRYNVIDVNERYAEGITKQVPYKGEGEKWLKHVFSGLRNSLAGLGFKTIEELQASAVILPRTVAATKGSS